jgi:bisphosphoglycerate-dependent phosphoglycerate mutase
MSSEEEIVNNVIKKSRNKYGLFCLNCLILRSSFQELNEFIKKNNIFIIKEIQVKLEYIKALAVHYYNVYNNLPEIQEKYKDSTDLMGDILLSNDKIKEHLPEFDYISKHELIGIFSDYCADLGISVFNTEEIMDYSLDLYLTKKTPLLKTEAVFIKTGHELNESSYQETLNLIEKASSIASWLIFVTTPAGAYKIGLDKLISDMGRLHTWLYVVDPLHKKIYGVTKGKKSKTYLQKSGEEYIRKLPREPIRAPSQVIKFSKYDFKENESYNPKNFHMFGILTEEEHKKILEKHITAKKYKAIFRSLLIIDINSGLSFFSYSSETDPIDDILVSGFLSAMDSFVSEIGGSTSLKEINYKGFFIHAAYGEKVKMALFLSQPADQILKDYLAYFLEQFEINFKNEIDLFKQSGDTSVFDKAKITKRARNFLSI